MFAYALKVLLKLAGGILLLIGVFFLVAFLLSAWPTHPAKLDCIPNKEVFLSSNGIHLDIIFHKKDLPLQLTTVLQPDRTVNFAAIGYGDRAFYLETPTWDDLNGWTTLKALFWKTSATVHVTKLTRSNANWPKISLCPQQFDSLLQYVDRSFQKDELGRPVEIKGKGYTKTDHFFEANGHVSCLHTCNQWVCQGLKKAEVKTSVWSPFDWGVLYHLR